MLAARILFLARTSRWAMVASGTRKARAISGVCSPAISRRVSATWASGARAGWQQVKIRRSWSSATGPTVLGVRRVRSMRVASAWRSSRVDSRRMRSIPRLRAVVMIQPAGLGGRPVVGPALQRDHEGVLDRFLGEVDVAEEADQGGHRSSRLGAEDPLDVGRVHWARARSGLGLVLERAHLDRAAAGDAALGGPAQGGVEVGRRR